MAKTRRYRRRGSRKQRGGMCPLAFGGGLGEATRMALNQGGQFAANTRSYHGGARGSGTAYGVNPGSMAGGRRRSRRMRGGMAPLSTAFGQDGAGVMRASAHLSAQDAALAQAAAFSRTLAGTDNPGASGGRMVGGRRRRGSKHRMRGGAILNGDGAPVNASYQLLADSPALQRGAAMVENPAWAGVAKMQFA